MTEPRIDTTIRLADGRRLAYVGRPASGSPATGSGTIHFAEQELLVRQAFE